MRRGANFNPEWGYLAPAPSFIRTARLVVVAAAVGATAGAAVVFSLVDRPAAEQSVAARTLVQQPEVSVAMTVGAPVAAQLQTESRHTQSRADPPGAVRGQAATLSPANVGTAGTAAGKAGATSITPRPPSAAALAEAPALTDAPPPAQGANETVAAVPEAATAATTATAQKPPNKKPRLTMRAPRYTAPRYGYDAQRYDEARYGRRYVQMERDPFGWQRPFGAPEY